MYCVFEKIKKFKLSELIIVFLKSVFKGALIYIFFHAKTFYYFNNFLTSTFFTE